ncbi:hypothetical protein [Ignicoccus hospitalis]|uniref:Uncharacterized protein n=1 Tax=Ignicoccus hospitalis (strain KIN4/I / DSM 18386 / JCM 14125) TaxID=453591 RepID=A8A9L3_IGNH4|nr:hypothetical protein [Ignicoccus hospitalis]ABU81615.1 hypothetical protein Igni_0432 [Ignicoccus hospitalis KIN4/I]HIH90188.1 hypothetical protein [Desulfurococcaceae archaeon]
MVYIIRKIDVFDESKITMVPQYPPLKRFTELVEWSRTGPYSGYVRRRDPATGEEIIVYIKP